MNIVLSVLAVVILTTGIILGRNVDKSEVVVQSIPEPSVLSQEKNIPDLDSTNDLITESPEPTEVDVPDATVSPVASHDNTTRIDAFVYPNSTLVSKTSSRVMLQSGDDPNLITDWYKQKIQSENMNVNSFVVTSVNDTVINKLSSSNSSVQIDVSIEKTPTASTTSVTIDIK